MFNFKKTGYGITPRSHPNNIDLRQNIANSFESSWNRFANRELPCYGPIQRVHVACWYPDIITFAASDGTQQSLYLRMRKIHRRAKALCVKAARNNVISHVSFNIESTLPCNIEFPGYAFDELNFVLVILC